MAIGGELKVYSSWELLEKTDPGEWSALNDGNKQIFQLLISAGTICFSNGSAVRDMFLALFPVGTTTGDNFRAM